ncbi:hypothetical protein [Paludisphaera mucosa]|uniref:Uncharacterized protein n=1 Tax=Paludisphaera mucosa TaxID=3030827 RepID=A0ABT6FDL4_9BACT|nr:hypothetical protein [Paludisphaera mucosa]MDG3005660.1 hypothetical protein [Paludisphaera mucosa]
MSTNIDPTARAEDPDRPQVLDLTGLPGPVIDGLRTIVANLRGEARQRQETTTPRPESGEERLRRFWEYVESRGARVGAVRDDREGIYEGRGE